MSRRRAPRPTSPPVLVVVSSLAAAGPAENGKPRIETDPPAPVSHYGRSKLAGEGEVAAVAHRLPVTVVRPPIVLGQRDRLGLPLFRSIARFGVHVVPTVRQRPYSVIHVDDLVRLLILAAERGKRLPPRSEVDAAGGQGCYFAAADQSPTYADLGRIIAAAMDRRPPWVIPVTSPGVWALGLAGEAISQLIRRTVFMNLDKVCEITAGAWLCSAAAARRDLQFVVDTPLSERMRQTAQWYRREGWL